MIDLLIQHGSTIQKPAVVAGAKLTLERKGTPGTLDFTVVKSGTLNFQEGDPVKLIVDGTPMFYGFVFRKSRNKDENIKVLAYDQLRYLKNKDTLVDEGLTASDILRRIAQDFRLQLGTVEDTGYKIGTIVEENQTLIDMVLGALDETLLNTGKLYVLYDECGKLCLKNINTMRLDILINAEACEDFDYESSIDSQTYNKIKLTFENKKTGKRDIYMTQDGANVNQWGVLQYHEALKTEIGAAAKANALLSLYNHKSRKLIVKGVFGDTRVHGGSAVAVSLNLGDMVTNQWMIVNRVVHTFKGQEHTMDLDLIGGEFLA